MRRDMLFRMIHVVVMVVNIYWSMCGASGVEDQRRARSICAANNKATKSPDMENSSPLF